MKALVAGSLRAVWQPLMVNFYDAWGLRVETAFGPAANSCKSCHDSFRNK